MSRHWSHYPLPTLPLDPVLYVLEGPFNLIFVSKLTYTLPCFVTFTGMSVLVLDRSTGKIIGKGHEFRGLYYFLAPAPPIFCYVVQSPDIVYQRLGNPSLSNLCLMVRSLPKVSTLEFESCHICDTYWEFFF